MASRSSPDVRRASLLLSGLVLTGDDSLEAFRDRRVGDSGLDTAHLKRAREVLDAVHEAITAGDEGRWRRLEDAWKVLCESEGAGPADAGPADVQIAEADGTPKAEPSPPPSPVASPPNEPPPPSPSPAMSPVGAPTATASTGPSPWAKRGDGAAPASQREPAPAPASPPPVSSPAPRPASPPASPPPGHQPVPPPAAVSAPPRVPAGIDPSKMSNVQVRLNDTTQPVDDNQSDRTVLPFAGTAKPPPSAVGDVKEAMDALGQTVMDESSGPPMAVTLPFKMPPGVEPPAPEAPCLPSHLSGLNLEHYAALCAERDVYKGWEAQVEARYGINNEDDKNAVDAHFRAQLKADTKQMQVWRKHYARVEAWAREQRGS